MLKDGSVLSEEKFKNMHNWVRYEAIESYINSLNRHNVFFSSPLDIDFLMIEHFLTEYIETLSTNEGPQLKLNEENGHVKIKELSETQKGSTEYAERIEKDLRKVLKENGGEGDYYTSDQKELMIWYSYFFLGRGKPVTHLQALNFISNQQLTENSPTVFKEMTDRIKEMLK